jgi:hypothetical protein
VSSRHCRSLARPGALDRRSYSARNPTRCTGMACRDVGLRAE